MKHLTELLTYRALHFKLHTASGDPALLDIVAEDEDYASKLQLKNVCAKLSVQLSDRIDNTCNILEISKRRFIEAAIINALEESDRINAELDIFEHVEQKEGK